MFKLTIWHVAGERWVYAAQFTVADATAEAAVVLWDVEGRLFGGRPPRDLTSPGAEEARSALQGCLAALRNETSHPRHVRLAAILSVACNDEAISHKLQALRHTAPWSGD